MRTVRVLALHSPPRGHTAALPQCGRPSLVRRPRRGVGWGRGRLHVSGSRSRIHTGRLRAGHGCALRPGSQEWLAWLQLLGCWLRLLATGFATGYQLFLAKKRYGFRDHVVAGCVADPIRSLSKNGKDFATRFWQPMAGFTVGNPLRKTVANS